MADLPKFTPFNCNFFKRTISAADQSKLLGSGGGERQRLVEDKASVLYDKKK